MCNTRRRELVCEGRSKVYGVRGALAVACDTLPMPPNPQECQGEPHPHLRGREGLPVWLTQQPQHDQPRAVAACGPRFPQVQCQGSALAQPGGPTAGLCPGPEVSPSKPSEICGCGWGDSASWRVGSLVEPKGPLQMAHLPSGWCACLGTLGVLQVPTLSHTWGLARPA